MCDEFQQIEELKIITYKNICYICLFKQNGRYKHDDPLDHSINISLLKSIIDYDRYEVWSITLEYVISLFVTATGFSLCTFEQRQII